METIQPTQDPHQTILLLEDDHTFANEAHLAFMERGYLIRCVSSAEEGLGVLGMGWMPSLVVIDLLSPTSDVLTMGRALRANGATSILVVLPGSDPSADRLTAAANMHILRRPFTASGLLDTVDRIKRLRKGLAALQVGPLCFTPGSRHCVLGGDVIDLGSDEAVLLERLMTDPGVPISRSDLFSHLSGVHRDLDPRIVDVFLVRLMVKIGSDRGVAIVPTATRTGYTLQREGTSSLASH